MTEGISHSPGTRANRHSGTSEHFWRQQPRAVLSPHAPQIVRPSSSADLVREELQGDPEERLGQQFPEANESQESGATEKGESELSFISGRSMALPVALSSIISAEELAKLRPRMDARLFPSPG